MEEPFKGLIPNIKEQIAKIEREYKEGKSLFERSQHCIGNRQKGASYIDAIRLINNTMSSLPSIPSEEHFPSKEVLDLIKIKPNYIESDKVIVFGTAGGDEALGKDLDIFWGINNKPKRPAEEVDKHISIIAKATSLPKSLKIYNDTVAKRQSIYMDMIYLSRSVKQYNDWALRYKRCPNMTVEDLIIVDNIVDKVVAKHTKQESFNGK